MLCITDHLAVPASPILGNRLHIAVNGNGLSGNRRSIIGREKDGQSCNLLYIHQFLDRRDQTCSIDLLRAHAANELPDLLALAAGKLLDLLQFSDGLVVVGTTGMATAVIEALEAAVPA